MIKIGLIGCGFMGGMHSACYNVIEGAKVVAVADVRPEKAEEAAKLHGAEIYATGEELIKNADVDVVDICLPTYLHTNHAVLAMKAGKNVFLEKPVCLTKEEGELLLKTQEETGAIVQVGQVIRMWDEYVWLKEKADSGEFGKIHSAVFKRLSSYPTWAWDNWLHQGDKSGSIALDMHIHDVDFVLYLFGMPDAISSVSNKNHTECDVVATTFKYGDAFVNIKGDWSLPQSFPFSTPYKIVFENAMIEFDGFNKITLYEDSSSHIIDIGEDVSSIQLEIEFFVDLLLNDKKNTVNHPDNSKKTIELIEKICYSAENGGIWVE